MIETPRAALDAKEIAEVAEFFSFGTNDLTQMAFGFSRDDVESRLMPVYLEEKLLAISPFEEIDVDGVGRLMEIAVAEGRATRPDIKLGICGEHGGNPASVAVLRRGRPRLRVVLAVPGSDRAARGCPRRARRGRSRRHRLNVPTRDASWTRPESRTSSSRCGRARSDRSKSWTSASRRARVRLRHHDRMLRPGGTVSGPTLMALADTAMWVAVLGAVGPVAMTVTTHLDIDFLRFVGPHDVVADVRLLKLGQRLAVGDVLMTADGATEPSARASVTYCDPARCERRVVTEWRRDGYRRHRRSGPRRYRRRARLPLERVVLGAHRNTCAETEAANARVVVLQR